MLIIITGCGDNKNIDDSNENTNKDGDKIVYKSITAYHAKKLMDQETDYVILDVRTEEEYAEGHIENAVLLPDYEIGSKAESILTDKNQMILVYCRSGRRSADAAKELISLGYTNVLDFGGIIDWTYEMVK